MSWYKKSQALVNPNAEQTEQNIGNLNVNVRPIEPLVIESVRELQSVNPGILDNVTDINIDLGYGQFGSVTNISPNTINLNMNRIKEEAAKETGRPITVSDPEDAKILKHFIKQTIVHELGHLGDLDPETGQFPGGESVAERAQQQFVESNPI